MFVRNRIFSTKTKLTRKRKTSFLITAFAFFAFSVFALKAFSSGPAFCCGWAPEETCATYNQEVQNPSGHGVMVIPVNIPGIKKPCTVE